MTALLVIAAAVALVWGAVFFRQTGLVGGGLAVLLAGTCFGHAFFHANFGPLPVTLDRVLLGIVVALYLLLVAWGCLERRGVDAQDLVLLGFMLFLMLSTITHDWRSHGFRAPASLLFFYLMPASLYVVLRGASISRRAVWGVLGTLAVFGLYLSVTSLLEVRGWWSFVFPRYIVSDAFPEFLGRGRGPLLNPVGNGVFLCAGWFSLLMFWPRVGLRGKAAIAALSLVYLGGLYGTLTRGVWLAGGLGVPLLIALNLPRRQAAAFLALLALVAGGALSARRHELAAFKRDIHVSVRDMARSASLRPLLSYVAWQVFLDHPLTGCGYRQYEQVHGAYLSDRATPLVLEQARGYVQHNVFLSLLAETGLIGVGLFVVLLIAWGRTAWRLWRAECGTHGRSFGLFMLGFLVAYLAMAMFHDLALIPMVNMLLFFLAGVQRSLVSQGAGLARGAAVADLPASPEACSYRVSCV